VLRVQSVLRRSTRDVDPVVVESGGVRVDVAAHEAWRAGERLALTGREFDLLAFLIRHPRVAFTRAELLERVWGWTYGDHSTVTVHVRRLREKIENDPTHPALLGTVWGVGYRWELP
jgi:DNA-binding response OmpR family regulator